MLPNLLSALRIPLALLFLSSNPLVRISAILMAMGSDVLDGFLARRWSLVSRLGTWIDPIADKIFVVFALYILLQEHSLETWKVAALFSRDIAIAFFALYLAATGKMHLYRLKIFVSGKVATSLQLILLGVLCLGYSAPSWFFYLFVVVGVCAFVELLVSEKDN